MQQLERIPLPTPGTRNHRNGELPPRRGRAWKRWPVLAAAGAIVALAILVFMHFRAPAAPALVTQPVQRGTLAQSVTATGTVNPQDTIAVGSQVSGTISEIGVDYNSHVRKGQVLARIDPTPFQAALDQAESALAQSRAQARAAQATAGGAGDSAAAARSSEQAADATSAAQQANATVAKEAVATAGANVAKSQAALNVAQTTVQRDKELLAQGYISQSQLDSDAANLVSAQAGLTGSQVAAQQAQLQATAGVSQAAAAAATAQSQAAQTAQSAAAALGSIATSAASSAAIGIQQAQVEAAELNLKNTIITSPVDGTVISRGVSVGQTVASSFQTPTLFSIAADLAKMEVDVAVGEPDIGGVKPGQHVDFSVLAYPGVTFHGTVSQVRQDPTTVNNVVTYDTVVLVDNRDGKLYPGMTASATIDVASKQNALIVPLSALQWHPAPGGAHKRVARPQGTQQTASGSQWGQTDVAASAAPKAGSTGRIFVQSAAGKLQRVPVSIDLVNQTQAAVTPLDGAKLTEGAAVVTGSASGTAHAPSQSRSGGLTGGRGGLGAIH
jgi:HlyD family secretion protein